MIFLLILAVLFRMSAPVHARKFMPTVCVDTNIWVYSLGTPQAKDVNKQVMAQAAIKSAGKITLKNNWKMPTPVRPPV